MNDILERRATTNAHQPPTGLEMVLENEAGPVTTSIERRVVSGREREYEEWLRGITSEALKLPGHMGVNVVRPTHDSRRYVTIFRFDNYEHSRAWEDSPIRQHWLEKLDGIIEGEEQVRKATGMEFWFSLPELPAAIPSPHKMVLVLLVVVFCLVTIFNALLLPLTEGWIPSARVFLIIFCQVTLMTYFVMPRVTRLLKGWLYN